jgi:hypothetical protein
MNILTFNACFSTSTSGFCRSGGGRTRIGAVSTTVSIVMQDTHMSFLVFQQEILVRGLSSKTTLLKYLTIVSLFWPADSNRTWCEQYKDWTNKNFTAPKPKEINTGM